MTKHLIRGAVGILLISLAAVSFAFTEEQRPDLKSLVAGNNAFALDLYSMLKKERGNLFLSPYSISSALAMTYGGARGDTAREMAKTMHFLLGPDKTHPAFAELDTVFGKIQKGGQVQLSIANSLWPQKGCRFLPEYMALVKRYYGVSITPVDYVNASEEARKVINGWVEKTTKDKIKELIRPGALDRETLLVLVNAIYFKGNWASRFDPKQTTSSDFSLPDGAKTQVPMMYQKGSFGYGEIEDAQLLELPYVGKELSMVIILPRSPGALTKIEDQLTPENLGSWIANLSFTRRNVNVYLPRFKVTWGTFELKKTLQTLGMRKAFAGADFSGMDGTRALSIGAVLHKAFVEVNEEGTEAAASTAVIMGKSLSETFRANHPFLFLIRDNVTGSILFLGRLLDPSQKKG